MSCLSIKESGGLADEVQISNSGFVRDDTRKPVRPPTRTAVCLNRADELLNSGP
jgi:hypothetical protein